MPSDTEKIELLTPSISSADSLMHSSNVKEVKIKVQWCVKDLFFMPNNYAKAHAKDECAECQLTVYVQCSDIEKISGAAGCLKDRRVILTVHDVGSNPLDSFIPLVNSPAMAEWRERRDVVFLHVCIPGQESGAIDFAGDYPTADQMAELLPQVLEYFGTTHRCFAMGEGAGADTVCRCALVYPERLRGIVLIHCTSTPHGIIENLREIFTNLQIDDGKMNHVAWDYLLTHKFGQDYKELKKPFVEHVQRIALNPRNLSRLLYCFSYRSDFTDMLKQKLLKVNTILVTGSKSPHNKNVFHMYEHMDKKIASLLVAENATDVLREAPEYLAQALMLLWQHKDHQQQPKDVGTLGRSLSAPAK